MKPFVPPYPDRPEKDLGPIKTLLRARKDLLSIWPERSFSNQFMSRKIFNQQVFIANTPELVKHVFVTKNDIYERKSPQMRNALDPLLGDGLFISDGETWKSRRKLQTPMFNSKHVKMFAETMITTIDDVSNQWPEGIQGDTFDVLPAMGRLTAEVISRTLFGEKLGAENSHTVTKAFADYQSVIDQMAIANFLGLPEWFPNLNLQLGKAKKAAKVIHDIVDEIVEKASHQEHQNTLASLLIQANQTPDGMDHMTKVQIRNEIIVLFMAGHETTANVLSWTWYLLSQSPEVEQRLFAEIDEVLGKRLPKFEDISKLKYTRAILDETMRLYPPVPILSRQSNADDEIRGKHIPASSIMLVVPWLIQRHKKYWDQPDAFIPERFLGETIHPKFAYLPFSAGPRVCIGKAFGLTESVLAVAMLAQRFRFSLPKGTQVKHECRLTLRPEGSLKMDFERR